MEIFVLEFLGIARIKISMKIQKTKKFPNETYLVSKKETVVSKKLLKMENVRKFPQKKIIHKNSKRKIKQLAKKSIVSTVTPLPTLKKNP